MTVASISVVLLLSFGCSSWILYVYGQSSDSFRIPNNGDSCNVINLNFGREEDMKEQARGPQGPPGKRGSTGLNGPQGDKGEKGSVGPRGITPEVDAATVTAAVFKAIGATSCEELMNDHGMSESGFYLMRLNEIIHPVYTYCDFNVRPEVTNCRQLRKNLGEEFKTGYYLVDGEDSEQTKFILCSVKDCEEVSISKAKIRTKTGGVFRIFSGGKNYEVSCDLETDGGGWTLFQKRFDGSVDFERNWIDYVNGFGKPDGEFWMGLEKLHQMTSDGKYELRIDMEDWEGSRKYSKYSTFSVAGSSDKYKLRVGGYSGNANDSFGQHDDTFFSTPDVDNDEHTSSHCAKTFKGGWWFTKICFYSHLNGIYHDPSEGSIKQWQGIIWEHWKKEVPLKSTEMKFRRKQ